jgi:SRSO17 transposase
VNITSPARPAPITGVTSEARKAAQRKRVARIVRERATPEKRAEKRAYERAANGAPKRSFEPPQTTCEESLRLLAAYRAGAPMVHGLVLEYFVEVQR